MCVCTSYVRVCACVFCVYVCLCVCVFVHVYVYVYVYIYIYIYICMYVCMYVYAFLVDKRALIGYSRYPYSLFEYVMLHSRFVPIKTIIVNFQVNTTRGINCKKMKYHFYVQ